MSRLIGGVVLAAMVATINASPPAAQLAAPTPESVLGFAPCADYKLATYEAIADYFRKLDNASDRLQLFEIGKTAEGRTQLLAVISSEENLKQLATYKDISRRLAQARGLTDQQAHELARQGKAVIWIDFGLHSSEVAHAQTAPWMAYKAVTDESDEMRAIRDNVIFVLVPNMNPDGTTLVANWYMKHVGTPFERSSPPELYQKYVGHDNNRDWFMFNMPESQNIARQLYVEWFPQIVYNQHQAAPFPARIFVPPFEDPMNPNIPVLVMRGINTVGDAITRRLDQEGKRGAISRHEFDSWWNGGMRTAPYFHNMVGILTEAAHPSATPATNDPKRFPKEFANGVPTLEPTTYYPSPYLGGEWHLRDTCEYMITASMAVLDIGAKRRTEWLYDIYQMGRDAIRAGEHETYVVPAEQWDPGAAVRMINALRWGGIDVERATAPFSAGGRTYAEGSFVIRGAQPFRAHVTDLLNPQVYPDRRLYPGGPPEPPYDITGWTLPMQMGVHVDRLAESVTGSFAKVEMAALPSGHAPSEAKFAFVIDPRHNNAFTAINRLLKSGDVVHRSPVPLDVGGARWPAGTFLIADRAGTAARLEQAANTLGIAVASLDRPPPDELVAIRPPRIGLYQGYGGNTDEGWTRWLLEQYEFPFTTLVDRDIRAGNLYIRFDVLVLPDASYDNMLRGLTSDAMPPEYTGGMTPHGVANLYNYVASGGTLVTMDTASQLPLTMFGLPIRDVTANQRESEFYIPGTLLQIEVDNQLPVAYGMPDRTAGFFAQSPAFAVSERASAVQGRAPREASASAGSQSVQVVARYPESGLLLSGWLLGDHVIAGRAAVLDARVEKGHVVLLGFRTQHRGQAHATFKLLFNSLYPGTPEPTPPSGSRSRGARRDGGRPDPKTPAVREFLIE